MPARNSKAQNNGGSLILAMSLTAFAGGTLLYETPRLLRLAQLPCPLKQPTGGTNHFIAKVSPVNKSFPVPYMLSSLVTLVTSLGLINRLDPHLSWALSPYRHDMWSWHRIVALIRGSILPVNDAIVGVEFTCAPSCTFLERSLFLGLLL